MSPKVEKIQQMQAMKGNPASERRGSRPERDRRRLSDRTGELVVFAAIVALLNLPLLGGKFSEVMIVLPQRVAAGKWWGVVTHPFVHLSWCHLLLDAGAVFLVYGGLEERSRAGEALLGRWLRNREHGVVGKSILEML